MDANQIISVTDFRRNAGSYFDGLLQGKTYILVKGSYPIGKITPLTNFSSDQNNLQKDLDFIKTAAKKYAGRKSLSPDELNRQYDKIYDQMLPR